MEICLVYSFKDEDIVKPDFRTQVGEVVEVSGIA
jgi:hypothetical protein